MKLLLDEMFSPTIARSLRARGHDVESVSEHPEWRTLSDENVIMVATREQRAVVTTNVRDYRPLHRALAALGGNGHAGVVFVPASRRLSRKDVGSLISDINALLQRYPGEADLANGEAWL